MLVTYVILLLNLIKNLPQKIQEYKYLNDRHTIYLLSGFALNNQDKKLNQPGW
jgi:hypothetical protein